MASVNKVILIGNLGRDPELRYTTSGTPVANFSIATTARWKDPDTDERKERTEWHKVVVWGKQAEIVGEYCRKGGQVYVEGSLQTREWTDRDGNKRQTTEVRAQRFQMLGARGDAESSAQREPQEPTTTTAAVTEPERGFEDDDIPF